jgi:hypothetical protein
MAATTEDEREAVNMGVSLSSQLLSAAFALMGIIGGFITYILENENSIFTYTSFGGGLFLYACSIYQGSIGITVARNNGFLGNWKLNVSKKYFNRQSIYLVIGTLLLILTIFLTKEQEDLTVQAQKKANVLLEKNLSLMDSCAARNAEFGKTLHLLQNQVDSLKRASVKPTEKKKKGHGK